MRGIGIGLSELLHCHSRRARAHSTDYTVNCARLCCVSCTDDECRRRAMTMTIERVDTSARARERERKSFSLLLFSIFDSTCGEAARVGQCDIDARINSPQKSFRCSLSDAEIILQTRSVVLEVHLRWRLNFTFFSCIQARRLNLIESFNSFCFLCLHGLNKQRIANCANSRLS